MQIIKPYNDLLNLSPLKNQGADFIIFKKFTGGLILVKKN
jgi:hypothetical protein